MAAAPLVWDLMVTVLKFSVIGAFIVNYDERNWQMLVRNFNSLPLNIKLQLLTDSFVLADAGLAEYSIFLNMSVLLIPDEQHLPLWLQYFQLVEKFNRRFEVHLGNKYKVTFFLISQQWWFFGVQDLKKKMKR